ncbi:hypothetical protein FRC0421_02398 [Corynebacterium diphtheriae]|nr:hypothetical protein FRC0209_00040 [Corynebacterium diphtheriae]CAB0849172.1 hypothetical protein FRC0323_01395 [Corynebacterium diphtheriae]CAB0922344.1 hypothetical protein FRC0421_02398 [Corynebacterium diphtheriae]
MVPTIPNVALRGVGRFSQPWLGWDWLALVGAPPPLTPEKTALHTKSSQTTGFLAIWCEALRKILRNTPV